MSEGKVCVKAGKVAGTVVRKTNKGVEKVKGGTMTICKKVGDICGSRLRRLKTKKKKAVSKLGVEIWGLYEGKIFKSVFEQDRVKELVSEIEGYDKEIQELKKEIETRRKEKERRAIIKAARADLKSKDPGIRKAAIRVLDKLGDKSSIPYLNKVLDDPEKEVRESAAKVLHKLVNTVASTAPVTEEEKLPEPEEENQEEPEEQTAKPPARKKKK